DLGQGCVPTSTVSGCVSDADCPLGDVCLTCSDGSCAPRSAYCMYGKCFVTQEQCPGLQWFATCATALADGGRCASATRPCNDDEFDGAPGSASRARGEGPT